MAGMKDLLGDELFVSSRYPTRPGFRGAVSGTSALAAKAVTSVAQRARQAILQLLQETPRGLTVDEGLERLGITRPRGQPRFSELKQQGKIVDSGERRRSAFGSPATVWIIAPSDPMVASSGGER